LVRFLLSKGVDALYLTGSTGETFLMDGEERSRVVEVVADEVAGRIPLIVHIGDIGTRKSIELAKAAERCNVAAISSVPPFYWRFSADEVVRYYREICEAVALPMVVYNVALAGTVDFSTIVRLASIEGVEGIKYTASTHHEIVRIKDEIGKEFKVYSGSDEMALSGLSSGADGLIGSFYNIIPEIFIGIWETFIRNDLQEAMRLQEQADAIIVAVLAHPMHASMKYLLSTIGVDAGFVRSPFSPLTREEGPDAHRRLAPRQGAVRHQGSQCAGQSLRGWHSPCWLRDKERQMPKLVSAFFVVRYGGGGRSAGLSDVHIDDVVDVLFQFVGELVDRIDIVGKFIAVFAEECPAGDVERHADFLYGCE